MPVTNDSILDFGFWIRFRVNVRDSLLKCFHSKINSKRNAELLYQNQAALEYRPTPTNMDFVNNYKNAMLYGTFACGDAPTDPRKIMTCYTPAQTVRSRGHSPSAMSGFAPCRVKRCRIGISSMPPPPAGTSTTSPRQFVMRRRFSTSFRTPSRTITVRI